MTKFYICTTAIAKGPYRLHEIDTLNIDSNDLIWSDEYQESRKAIQVPELRAYFKKKKAERITIGESNNGPLLQKIILVMLLFALVVLVGYYFTTF